MQGDWLFKVVPLFIGLVFVLIVGYFGAIAFLAYKAVDIADKQDWSGGIKPIIERLWCGKPGCMDATPEKAK